MAAAAVKLFHVNNNSLVVLPIPASGNCLFLSVGYFWKGIIDETVALQLRNMDVNFVSQHWDNFGAVLSVVLSEGNVVINSPQQYAEHWRSQNSEVGGHS